MGIQGFTASSSGLPGLSFIGQVMLTTGTRDWAQAGGPGTYTIRSSKNEAGYVYFIGATTVGGPLNGVVSVPANFTSIKIIGVAGDLCSLYKVSVKTTTGFSTSATITTYTSSVTGTTLSSNKTGFVDALLIGGGGGRGQHGSGGGAGGVLLLNSFPLDPNKTFDVQVGAYGGSNQGNGGDSIFAATVARGGGGANSNEQGAGKDGGCGSGGVGQSSNLGGKSTQGTGTTALVSPLLFFSAYGGTASAQGYGNAGSPGNGSTHTGHGSQHSHNGGGGGGAGGAASSRNGGAGVLLNFEGTNKYYSAGGYGGSHSGYGHGSTGTGWNNSAGHYGMGGCSNDNSFGPDGTAGAVIIRSYNI